MFVGFAQVLKVFFAACKGFKGVSWFLRRVREARGFSGVRVGLLGVGIWA